MYATTVNQISVVDDFITYKCYVDTLLKTLGDFKSFLEKCESKSVKILIFLVIEFVFESLVCFGYFLIHCQNQRKKIIEDLLVQRLRNNELKEN